MIDTAIILAAGQGSRLGPLTADRPKCLIDFSGKTLLAWQVDTLFDAGISTIEVVTGFKTDMVEAELGRLERPGLTLNVRFNPFYKVADNLGSCWIAREAMDRDFLILNGDTLVSGEIVERVLAARPAPIAVTVDVKPAYDSDDMKVSRDGDRLLRIGKTLTAEESGAESIGLLAFRGMGAALFRQTVDSFMRTPAGVENWYLKAIDAIAPSGHVGVVSIEGHEWAEVDFLTDIEIATALTDRWRAEASRFRLKIAA